MDLICVGDVMLDVRVDAGELADGGDVHGTVRVHPGGTSANAAVWAAASGAAARVLGRVGDDVAGRLLAAELEARSVETSLVLDPGAPTGTMLVVHRAGERSMVADRGANARLRPSDLPDDLEAGALLVSGYLLLQEGAREAAVAAIGRGRAPLVAVEAASWPLIDRVTADGFHELAAGATAVLANVREAASLTGCEPIAAAEALGAHYRLACVKRGREGAVMVLDGVRFTSRADPVDELDPTGAGDAFDGVLLASLARGSDAETALDAACRAGAAVAASPTAWPRPASTVAP